MVDHIDGIVDNKDVKLKNFDVVIDKQGVKLNNIHILTVLTYY